MKITSSFNGSPFSLVQTLIRHVDLSEAERREIIGMIEKIEDDDERI